MVLGRRTTNSHDAFVRHVFSRREAVAILLRRVLPPELLGHVDFGSLRPGPTAHANPQLGTRHGDLHFIVDLLFRDQRIALYLAIEHQSTLDHRFPWRAHLYVGDIWRDYVQNHPGPPYTLPFVLPILLTQHPARDTPHRLTNILVMPSALREILGTPVELTLLVDDFSGSVLDDHHAHSATRALVELARAFLHAYRNPSALTESRMATLAAQVDLLLEHKDPGMECAGKEDLDALWTYVLTTFDAHSPVRDKLLSALSKPARESYMTIADELFAEGLAEGLAEGRSEGLAEGRASALLDLLELRALAVPTPLRERVLATRDESQLRRWLARALTIDSAEELFGV